MTDQQPMPEPSSPRDVPPDRQDRTRDGGRGARVGRRGVLSGALASVAVAGTSGIAAADPETAGRPRHRREHWIGSWGASPAGVAPEDAVALRRQTVRSVVRLSTGGDRVRIRLSNEFGDVPLHVGELRVARRAGTSGTDAVPGTDRPVRFGGRTAVTVPAGSPAVSDPVDLAVPDGADLLISLYLPDPTTIGSVHGYALQQNAVAAGNVTADRSVDATAEPAQWYLLSGVSVARRDRATAGAVVTLGDSITDGGKSTENTNRRWPDFLARRIHRARPGAGLGVVNAGISGNRLLFDPDAPPGSPTATAAPGFGPSALRRFDRDVLAQPGVRWVISLLGVNDIGQPGTAAAPSTDEVDPAELIAGYEQLINRAHDAGAKIFGGTIMPFKDTTFGFWSPAHGATWRTVNRWIRHSSDFDVVIDFAAATASGSDPERLEPRYDSGDGLHPNDAGCAAMAAAVPLDLFR